MSPLINAINQQIDQAIYTNASHDQKLQVKQVSDLFKTAGIVTAVSMPILAFFVPTIFNLVVCVSSAVIGYDLFNIADNLGDMAKQSADGCPARRFKPHIDVLLEDTLLTGPVYRKYFAP